LRLRVVADPSCERRLGDDGKVAFTIGDVELYCSNRRLTRQQERNIAMWFLLYGRWEEEATAEISDGELVGLDFIRSPPEDHEQGSSCPERHRRERRPNPERSYPKRKRELRCL